MSFEEHIEKEHNMWHYLYFIVLVKVKDPTEFTGPESYVYAMVHVSIIYMYYLLVPDIYSKIPYYLSYNIAIRFEIYFASSSSIPNQLS